jgi:hypothetical protein
MTHLSIWLVVGVSVTRCLLADLDSRRHPAAGAYRSLDNIFKAIAMRRHDTLEKRELDRGVEFVGGLQRSCATRPGCTLRRRPVLVSPPTRWPASTVINLFGSYDHSRRRDSLIYR